MTRWGGMSPRAGAAAEGRSGIVYLLLDRVEAGVGPDPFPEPCWRCLTLADGRFSSCAGQLAFVREEWLLDDAEELA